MRLRRYVPEFERAQTERDYRLAARDGDARFARGLLIVGNAVTIPFIGNDYHVLGFGLPFALCVACRFLWLVVGVAAWRAMRERPSPGTLDRWMLAWTSSLLFGAIVISSTRSSSSLTGVNIFQAIVFACYIVVPFRYSMRLGCGILGSLAYLAVQTVAHALSIAHLVPTFFALSVTNTIGALAAYRIESSRRQSHRKSLRLREAKRNADEANLSKSRFLAAASHDLRQPVHALGLFLGALREEPMSEAGRSIVEHMDESVHGLGELFTELLDISALDAGTVEPRFETVAIAPLLLRICREFAAQAHLKNLKLRTYDRALYVWSDPLLLERVIRNLVSNAVRYTDRGRIVVGCRRTGNSVEIRVYDTGRGIATQEQARIFEEFYAVNRNTGGLGLGLAIVKRLTELLKISLHLESTLTRGSLFALTIPGASADVKPALERDYTRLGPGLVLVIDDDESVLAAMQSLLKSWGLDTIAARSYAEALPALAAESPNPDLIICDLQLSDGDTGPDVVARLSARFGRSVPALLISGETRPEWLRPARERGFVVLHKPVPKAKLRAAVNAIMRKAHAAIG